MNKDNLILNILLLTKTQQHWTDSSHLICTSGIRLISMSMSKIRIWFGVVNTSSNSFSSSSPLFQGLSRVSSTSGNCQFSSFSPCEPSHSSPHPPELMYLTVVSATPYTSAIYSFSLQLSLYCCPSGSPYPKSIFIMKPISLTNLDLSASHLRVALVAILGWFYI